MNELSNHVAEEAERLNAALREREEPFWQRQRELTYGRIEPMEREGWWKKILKCLSGRDAAI